MTKDIRELIEELKAVAKNCEDNAKSSLDLTTYNYHIGRSDGILLAADKVIEFLGHIE